MAVYIGMVTALIVSFVLKHTAGLHVDENDQATGLDEMYRGMKPKRRRSPISPHEYSLKEYKIP